MLNTTTVPTGYFYPLLLSLPPVIYFVWHLRKSRLRNKDAGRFLRPYIPIYEAELLYRNDNILKIISPSTAEFEHPRKTLHYTAVSYHFGVLQDLDRSQMLYRKIMNNLSSCPQQLVAELRAWQQAAHVLGNSAINHLLSSSYSSLIRPPACIDSALAYISKTQSGTNDPIRDAMINSILAFPSVLSHEPAKPRQDDRERVMDRRVLFDEPHMQTLILSLDDESRADMNTASDREHARLPLFPAYFGDWELLSDRVSLDDFPGRKSGQEARLQK